MYSVPEKNIMLIVRLANSTDAMDVLRWRNDAQTRVMSWNADFIEPENHIAWFNAAINDPARIFLIGEIEDRKIGMVRFDACDDSIHTWRVNVVVAPESRSQGCGRILLAQAVSFFFSKFLDASLIAEIKIGNKASQRLFEKLGFSKAKIVGEILNYKCSNCKFEI